MSATTAFVICPGSAFYNKPLILIFLTAICLIATSCGPLEQNTRLRPNEGESGTAGRGKGSTGSLKISDTLPGASVGNPYHALVQVNGGPPPYKLLVSQGKLPPGLSLDATNRAIDGTPIAPGRYQFSLVASNRPFRDVGFKSLTMVVAAASKTSDPSMNVAISPTSAALSSGGSKQFSAIRDGKSELAVIWSTSAGGISKTGLFTAPVEVDQSTIIVTATSAVDPTKKASAVVTISPRVSNSVLAIMGDPIPTVVKNLPYVATLTASGGKLPYMWSIASGTLPRGLELDAATGVIRGTVSQAGDFSLAAMVTDSGSQSAKRNLSFSIPPDDQSGFDGPAELPRIYVQSSMADTPAAGKVIPVSAGGNLQQALTGANCGDTVALEAGATFSGQFTFPAKSCDDSHWIIVRTNAPDSSLPAEGTRTTPCNSGVSSLPGRPSFQCSSTTPGLARLVFAGPGNGPVIFATGANHYRLLGLEITRIANTKPVTSLASILSSADHIVFDRVWMHGTATQETRRGIGLGGGTYIAIVDSFFNDFHCFSLAGTCSDAQAVSGGIGDLPMGPYKISGNFLEASAQGILFGGGPATLAPADIEIRHNHFFKPMTWKKGQPGFVGVTFSVKNHLELKNAQRVLLEGNVMENSWGGFSQEGYSILITPKNQGLGLANVCPSCLVTDVTIRDNMVSHAGAGLQIANALSGTGAPSDGQRYSVHDDIFDDVDGTAYDGAGLLAQISMSTGTPTLQNLLMDHLTGFASRTLLLIGNDDDAQRMNNFTFTNSIVEAGLYPIWSTGTGGKANCAAHNVPLASLIACFSNWSFTNNAIIGAAKATPASSWPKGNFFPINDSSVGFVNYRNGKGGDYHLLPSSPYKNAGSDGKDLGADIDAVLSAIAGVR